MQDTKVKTKALDKGNCGAARHRGKEAGVKATSPRTGTGYEAGDADKFARQNEVRVSASQVKPGVVLRKSHPLPGEACPSGGGARERVRRTDRGNTGGGRAGVSRGHSSAGYEPGVGVHPEWGAPNEPEGLTHARRTELIGSVATAAACQLELALHGDGSGLARSPAAETDGAQVSELWAGILSPANLNEAWRRVRENGGAAGIDRMTVASFPQFFRAHGPAVLAKLQAGTLCPTCNCYGSPIITQARGRRQRKHRRSLKRRGNQIGTAGYGPVCPVVWGPEANYLRLPDVCPAWE